MEVEKLREWLKYISGIALPTLISISFTKVLYVPSNIWLDIAIVISILVVFSSGLCFSLSKPICKWHWKRKHKRRLRNSTIGIFLEEKLDPNKSRFSPEYWSDLVSDKYRTECFSGLDLNRNWDNYVAIINPYGECYPENNIGEKKTFNKIKEYVKNGGIFVNVCGAPFWYAWNTEVGQISTAGEVYGYQGSSIPTNKIATFSDEEGYWDIHAPFYNIVLNDHIYSVNPKQSLTDTLSNNELGLLTTVGPPRLLQLTQTENEIQKYEYYLPRFAYKRYIFEFRATRKPSKNFKPLVRADITYRNSQKETTEIFPLSYVPHGNNKGKFLFAGLHMDVKCGENTIIHIQDNDGDIPVVWTKEFKEFTDEILNEQPKLVYKALDVLIEEIKDKYLERNRSSSENNNTQNNPQTENTNNLNCRM